jgi:hypothetical protein
MRGLAHSAIARPGTDGTVFTQGNGALEASRIMPLS